VTVALAIAIVRLVGALQPGPLQPAEPVTFSITYVEDPHPKIIYIYNLDDGPRAIELKRARSQDADSSGRIRILNAVEEGVQEIERPLK